MSQSLSRILVHIIFSTKNRFAFLVDNELQKRMHAYLARVFNEHGSPAIEVGGTEDHIHILCLLSRNYAISEIIKKAKANSSSWAKKSGGQTDEVLLAIRLWNLFDTPITNRANKEIHSRPGRTSSTKELSGGISRDSELSIRAPYDARYLWE